MQVISVTEALRQFVKSKAGVLLNCICKRISFSFKQRPLRPLGYSGVACTETLRHARRVDGRKRISLTGDACRTDQWRATGK